jgi:formylmethanofuran--tetrahydromethanopterin N-formyltransferase
VLEIVIDGLSAGAVAAAMKAGLHAATQVGADRGLVGVTAGNYGGKLGRHHFRLAELMP